MIQTANFLTGSIGEPIGMTNDVFHNKKKLVLTFLSSEKEQWDRKDPIGNVWSNGTRLIPIRNHKEYDIAKENSIEQYW